jgi:hypothetical protein
MMTETDTVSETLGLRILQATGLYVTGMSARGYMFKVDDERQRIGYLLTQHKQLMPD